jgi:GNAT superfamily N-acetyltransferase
MVEIRPLTDADIDAVAAVHVRAWQAGYSGIIPADYLAALEPAAQAKRRRNRPGPPGSHTLVAEDRDTIVGFTSYGPYRVDRGDGYNPAIGELYAVYVDPSRWGTGIGRKLFAAARAALTAAGYPTMRLWVLEENHRSRRFYERAGLVPDGERHIYTPRGSMVELPELRYATRL